MRVFLADQDAAPSSYPEPRHLVGISTENAVPDVLSRDGVSGVVRVFDRQSAAPLGEGRQKGDAAWALERAQWETCYVLRELLAQYDERLSADCGGEGKVLQHAKSDRQRLTPYRCQVRAVCPCCGRAYGLEKGLEAVALLDALMEPGRLLTTVPEVKTWAIVLSSDERLSAYVHQLVIDGKIEQVRKILRHLTEDVQASLVDVFGPGVAALVSWHWWHSGNPLSGTHLHAHVTVPNVDVRLDPETGSWRPEMNPLRRRGVLSADELERLRVGYGERVSSHRWTKAAGIFRDWRPNAHVRFTTRADGQGYRHRARYDFRSPVSDLLAMVEPDAVRDARQLHADLLTEDELMSAAVDVAELACEDEKLSWWVHAAQFWQSIKTIRYTGWLVNSARKSLGLLKLPASGEPEWSSVGLYRVLNFDSDGVTVERWRAGGRYEEQWHADHVDLLPPPGAARGYKWDDQARPVVRPGPPLAWLIRSGLVRRDA